MNGEKANILLVDDNPANLLALEAILADLGENIVKANSGKEALRHLLREDFAAILMDVQMPEMDGFETAILIRDRQRSKSTPIIFTTAIQKSENHVTRGYFLGAVDYIFTPIVPEILRAKVSVFVDLFRATNKLKRQAGQLLIINKELEREIAERQRIEEALGRSENRLSLIYNTVSDTVFLLEAEGEGHFRYLTVNRAFLNIFGFKEKQVIGKSIEEVWPKSDSGYLIEKCREAIGESRPIKDEQTILLPRREMTFEITLAPIFNEQGQCQQVLGAAHDVTKRHRAEKELKTANEELEAFTYSVSHDLRAPLRAIQGFANILSTDYIHQIDNTGQSYMQRINESAKQMDVLIQDLLQYSKLSLMDIKLKRVNLEKILEEVLSQQEDELKSKKAKVVTEGTLPEVLGHHIVIRQVLTNLILNAIKFVAPGVKPRVKVWTEERDLETGNPSICLWVEDNGIGIPSEHQEDIFQVFKRLHGVETYPGTGIGLAIVRKGIERLGGRAGVESTPGQGSRFWVVLAKA